MGPLEEKFRQFKEKFSLFVRKNIQDNYGSLEEFASEKHYDLIKLKEYLDCKFSSEEELFKLVWDTNSSIIFKDIAGEELIFPELN